MLLFADAPSGQWMVIAAGAILGVWLLMRRPFKNRLEPQETKSAKQEGKQAFAGGYGLVDAPDQLAKWEVSMHETSRDLKAELDSKMVALQALVAMARYESERLEAAVTRAERLGISATRDSLAALERAAEAATYVVNEPMDDAPSQTSAPLPQQLRERIFAQADQGSSPATIAASVGIPVGDIEWMLSMRAANG